MRARLPRASGCTRRRFQLRPADLGENGAYSDAAARHLRRDCARSAAALRALDQGDVATYRAALAPTVPSRATFFEPPARLQDGHRVPRVPDGTQSHFRMLAGAEGARSPQHLTSLFGSPTPRACSRTGARRRAHGARCWPELDSITRLSLNQITTERASLGETVDACARHGVPYGPCGVTSSPRRAWIGPCASSATPESGSRACAAAHVFRRPPPPSAPRDRGQPRAVDDAAGARHRCPHPGMRGGADKDIAAARHMVADGGRELVRTPKTARGTPRDRAPAPGVCRRAL